MEFAMLPSIRSASLAAIALLFPHAVATSPAIADLTTRRLVNAKAEPGQWFTGGRDYQQGYYSPLADINAGNIRQLGFAWSRDIEASGVLEATPIVIDGVMFTSANDGTIYALNAANGAQRWSFKPKIDPAHFSGYVLNRGVAVWKGKVYVASPDGVLYAVDAGSGALTWATDTIVDRDRSYFSTGAPYVAGKVVVIGNSGAEYDARGYITAYDTATGKQKWRFFTVPGDPSKSFEHAELKMAAKTWDAKRPWELGGGGTAYDGMAYDPRLNLLYVGTGNGVPWNRNIRSPSGGDNLFLSSILAINPDTGRLVWHYQTTPGDYWDYTATQKLILADLDIGGKRRHVILQAPKNGFFYVLDRITGKLISAKPFAHVNWASHVDLKTGRPVLTGKGDYSKAPTLIFPSPTGAHNWHPMAYNPGSGLVYIPVLESAAVIGPSIEPFSYRKRQWNLGVTYFEGGLSDASLPPGWPALDSLRAGEPDPRLRSFLRAWDPIHQVRVWEVETTAENHISNVAGVMTTAGGLVFQGHPDGRLRVFDAKTGTPLNSLNVGLKLVAAPMTYRVEGQQYVSIMGTLAATDREGVQQGRIATFRLGGGEIPWRASADLFARDSMPPVADVGTTEQVALGGQSFANRCAMCHASSGRAPDLAHMSAQSHREFLDIVMKGRRLSKGMPNFGDVLSQEEAAAIHAYVIRTAWERYRQRVQR